jgi:hypothetical protein
MRRRILALALLVSSLTTLAVLHASLSEPAIAGFLAGGLALVAAAAALTTWRRIEASRVAIRVDAEGRIAARWDGDSTESALEPAFVSSWLVCLEAHRRGLVVVWRDALGADAYRRLAAASRWWHLRKPELGAVSDGLA